MKGVILAREGLGRDVCANAGGISATKRLVLTMIRAKISPILVITGEMALDVGASLSRLDVLFHEERDLHKSPMESVAEGTKAMGWEGEILYGEISCPYLSPKSLEEMSRREETFVVGTHEGKILPVAKFPLSYFDAMAHLDYDEITDTFDLLEASYTPLEMELLNDEATHNESLLRPNLKLSIAMDEKFYGPGVQRLLELVKATGSVKQACQRMNLSYSKAWKMVNTMERELGCEVIDRKPGGTGGGESVLTKEGELFLDRYRRWEEETRRVSEDLFHTIFME